MNGAYAPPGMLTKWADWQSVGKARTHGNLPAEKLVAKAFCRSLAVMGFVSALSGPCGGAVLSADKARKRKNRPDP